MKLAGLAVIRLVLESAHLDAESRVLVRGLHFLWQMKLKLLRELAILLVLRNCPLTSVFFKVKNRFSVGNVHSTFLYSFAHSA